MLIDGIVAGLTSDGDVSYDATFSLNRSEVVYLMELAQREAMSSDSFFKVAHAVDVARRLQDVDTRGRAAMRKFEDEERTKRRQGERL